MGVVRKTSDAGRVVLEASDDRAPGRSEPTGEPLRVVLCGSFRRRPDTLAETFRELLDNFEVLSPVGVDFVDPSAEFVRLRHELDISATVIEQRHLDAIGEADFVWLHAPDDLIGVSAMFELGHAKALGIPIFSDTEPAEETYRPWVHVVDGPAEVSLTQDMKAPGNGLRGLQRYYERAAVRRGWDDESVQDTLLLMTEEMGELARAVRKTLGISRDQEWKGATVAEEIADLQLYLVHLASRVGIDIADAVTDKESVNEARLASRETVA